MRHLLEHAAGLSARLLDRPPRDRRSFEHEICTMPLEYSPGRRFDLHRSRIHPARILPGATGGCPASPIKCRSSCRRCSTQAVLRPGRVCSRRSLRRPCVTPRRPRPLPEDERRGRRLVGEVHDNYAAALGGFAGHAGLFGTAPGVGAFARTALRAARNDLTLWPPFTPAAMRRATAKSVVPGSSRALGWDTMLPTSSCGTRMSASAFGHVGFTGTSLWIDPQRDRYYVLLTNRVCDGGTTEQMQQVRRAFHDIVSSM